MSKSVERGNRGLTQGFVDNAPVGRHRDHDGLFLVVKSEGRGSREIRKQHLGKRWETGFGGKNDISLKQARAMAGAFRAAILAGEDPLAAIGRERTPMAEKDWSLKAVSLRCFESKKASLKGGGEAGRWYSPLEHHVLPKLGKMDVTEITSDDVEAALKPIWRAKNPTAKKAADRLAIVMRFASDEGAKVDEAAVARAKRLLGDVKREAKHITSTPFQEIPGFYAKVCSLPVSAATLAIRLALLTCHRGKPVRLARVDEFDLDAMVWTVPAANLKGVEGATKDFRTPLSPEARRVAELAIKHSRGGKLFPAQRGGGVVSDVGMGKVFKRVDVAGTTHGLRSSFGSWAMENEIPLEMSDRCLQHMVGGSVSRAYHRDDLLDRRRAILNDWAVFATIERDAAMRTGLRVV